MNASQIHSFIANPGLIEASDLPALKDMAQLYPYAESIQLLYLSCVSKHANMYFDEALSSTAFRLSKRERIIDLLQESDTETKSVSQEEVSTNPVESALPAELAVEKPVLAATEDLKEEILPIEPVEETSKTEEQIEIPAEEAEVDILDELIYTTTATALEQDYFAGKEASAEESVTKNEETVSEIEKDITPEESGPIDISSTQLSFTSWLHRNANATEEQEQDKPGHSQHSKHTEEIIDRFIEKQPSISKPTAEFYSAPKKARESLDDSKTPVSETLAKIYVAQGNYPKAIHVYHQLILNNPEKKSLFAPRIEELKNKLS